MDKERPGIKVKTMVPWSIHSGSNESRSSLHAPSSLVMCMCVFFVVFFFLRREWARIDSINHHAERHPVHMWIWSRCLTFLFTFPSIALIAGPWRGGRIRQPWRLTSGVEMCMWIECGSEKGWGKRQVNTTSYHLWRDLRAQGNTSLCHHTACSHPLWVNVNNAWRSAIVRCSFARLLPSGTCIYLTFAKGHPTLWYAGRVPLRCWKQPLQHLGYCK